jgi:hypothetical protein
LETIEKDPCASRDLDLVVDLMNEASDPKSEVFVTPAGDERSIIVRICRSVVDLFRLHPVLYPAGVFACLAAALVTIISINIVTSNTLDELTGIDRTAFSWNARGTDNSDISAAYLSFTNGDYGKALSLLHRYLRVEPRGELTPYVQYTTGAVCLIASRQSYLSLFHGRNTRLVSEGLEHLSAAMSQTSNRRLLEESRLLRAKGYLMLQRPLAAIAELDTVRSLNGPRSEEAMQMIARIHALTP